MRLEIILSNKGGLDRISISGGGLQGKMGVTFFRRGLQFLWGFKDEKFKYYGSSLENPILGGGGFTKKQYKGGK